MTDQSLLDTAYIKARNWCRADGLAEAEAGLKMAFPKTSSGEVTKACKVAIKLRQLGDWGGWQWHTKQLTYEEVIAKMKEECPGFSEDTYEGAIGQGIVDNR